jgi:L-lactate utilization protein LutC
VPSATALSDDQDAVESRARHVLEDAERRTDELMDALAVSAAAAEWKVARVASLAEAREYVVDLAASLEARSVVSSAQDIVDQLDLESALSSAGVALTRMAVDGADDEQKATMRERAIAADLGVTGADYAIVETGSCVLLASEAVSRLVALTPPVHVAIVQRGQVLPSLDELFALRRQDFMDGALSSYMSLITGPSRSADIEYQLIKGVHGPGEVHMVLVG